MICRFKLWALPLAAALALGACMVEETGALSNTEKTACEARGGKVAIAGFSGTEFCAEPAADAGKTCTRASDCSSYCEADTRVCASHLSPFGCRSYLDETGKAATICVD